MKQDKWTQQLHDKLAEHETSAPEGLWADIEAALQQQPQPRQSRFMALRRWAVAASLAALMLGGGYLLWDSHDERMAENMQNVMVSDVEPTLPVLQDTLSKKEEHDIKTATPTHRHQLAQASHVQVIEQETYSEADPAEQQDMAQQDVIAEKPIASKQQDRDKTQTIIHHAISDEATRQLPSKPSVRKRKASPTIGLYAMNAMGAQNDHNGVIMAPSMAQQFSDAYENSQVAAGRSYRSFTLSGYEEHQHHYQPVTFGLTLSYPLTNRLSLMTGVVYTKLLSDFTQIMRSQQVQQEQTLHYVGVPLVLNYRLWHYKGLKTYLSAGGKADWNVATHLETEGVNQPLPKDRMQWSLNSSLGVQYDVIPLLGLYAEPGLSWYPDNGSRLQNYFKDKPLTFSLQIGLRLNLKR